MKFVDFNICPNTLHVNADTDDNADGIAIALLHSSAVALKSHVSERKYMYDSIAMRSPIFWNFSINATRKILKLSQNFKLIFHSEIRETV